MFALFDFVAAGESVFHKQLFVLNFSKKIHLFKFPSSTMMKYLFVKWRVISHWNEEICHHGKISWTAFTLSCLCKRFFIQRLLSHNTLLEKEGWCDQLSFYATGMEFRVFVFLSCLCDCQSVCFCGTKKPYLVNFIFSWLITSFYRKTMFMTLNVTLYTKIAKGFCISQTNLDWFLNQEWMYVKANVQSIMCHTSWHLDLLILVVLSVYGFNL